MFLQEFIYLPYQPNEYPCLVLMTIVVAWFLINDILYPIYRLVHTITSPLVPSRLLATLQNPRAILFISCFQFYFIKYLLPFR